MMNHIVNFNKQMLQTSIDLIKDFTIKLKVDQSDDSEIVKHIDKVYTEFNQDITNFKKKTLQSLNKKHNIKAKKPSSGWNLYMADMSNHPDLVNYAQKNKMSQIAEWWKELSDEVKNEYKQKAKNIEDAKNNALKSKKKKKKSQPVVSVSEDDDDSYCLVASSSA